MLRGLLIGIIVAFLAWGGYWAFGSRALERTVGDWIAATPEASAENVRVRGFPNRFDLTLTRPAYESPALGWTAPFAQVFALSYKPHHMIAVFPHDQSLRLNGTDWAISSSDMRASLVTQVSGQPELDRATLVIEALRARGITGEALQADTVRIASRKLDDDPLAHELGIEVLGLRLPPEALALADPAGALPAEVARLHLDAVIRFDRPLDVGGGPSARVRGLEVRAGRAEWGAVTVHAEGALRADAAGLISGEMAVTVTEWERLMEGARAAGVWDAGADPLITGLLSGLAREDGDAATITLPLTADRGTLYLGPFPLGALPTL
ncbi:MAG: DUF2125 domain-containing protein [Rhodobacteraceae bacterium]|nr:DUF2125 domain-containing protein [Paracoccaceae bacterium]